ncbi:MAG: DUF302 domain-containing protein [Methanococcaceae archaeon]
MNYYNTVLVEMGFQEAIEKVTSELGKEGFGVLTEIDVKSTLKKKLDVDFRPYKILGACNPNFAHKALLLENKIGTMLPCNFIVQELDGGMVEISAINPLVSMKSVNNPDLESIAAEVALKLGNVLNAVNSEKIAK